MGKFDRWYHTVKVPYKCGERIVVSIPNQKYVINEAYSINNVVTPICLVYIYMEEHCTGIAEVRARVFFRPEFFRPFTRYKQR